MTEDTCPECGRTEDVGNWTLDLDLPTIRRCRLCMFPLLNPLMEVEG
jgi:hypothetical protein